MAARLLFARAADNRGDIVQMSLTLLAALELETRFCMREMKFRLRQTMLSSYAALRKISCVSASEVTPNPSLEWTRSGMALGPRSGCSYHPPRGPTKGVGQI
jgi:hypothetical protein